MTNSIADSYLSQLGAQRDWVWRGWQVRYTYRRAANPQSAKSLPLLLLHGFGSALTQWQENLLPLSESHTVYALDLVGFGASEKAAANYSVGFWVEQVYEFWHTFIREPIVLVGHSLGALVALTVAATHPDMVQRLVLLTLPAARQELLPRWMLVTVGEIESLFASPLLIRPLFYLIRRPAIIRSVLRKIYVNQERITEQLIQNFLTPGFDRGAAQVLCRLTKARTKNDFSQCTKALLSQVQVPILLIWGSHDRVIPLKWGRQLPTLSTYVKLVEVPDAGHCPYDEQAEIVNTEILNWLSEPLA
ncbi:MAG: alpha/beta fold hydrolase [Elainellaceae cyanobacterium]